MTTPDPAPDAAVAAAAVIATAAQEAEKAAVAAATAVATVAAAAAAATLAATTTTTAASTAASLSKGLRGLMISTGVLYALVFLTLLFVYATSARSSDVKKSADSTAAALCGLKNGYVRNVASSTKFLKDHPEGFAGITAKQIQQGIDSNKAIIASFGDLSCK